MKSPLSGQKLRGGYYTPQPIADFLGRWAVRSPNDTILEPSCGDGNLLTAAVQLMLEIGAAPNKIEAQVVGVEFEPSEAEACRQRLENIGIAADKVVHIGDFFTILLARLLPQPTNNIEGQRFDAVIGNPPFIRYQNFPEDHREGAFKIMRSAGLHPSRLTNAWAPFLVASTRVLSERGRLAMVVPAELFQVGYAAEVREYLSNFFKQITIVTFRKLVFDDIQQEVVLLLCEREGNSGEGVRVVELEDASQLDSFQNVVSTSSELKPMDHSSEKWTQYFLNTEEILLLRKLRNDPRLTRSGVVLDVDVGIVTGDNNFFILKEAKAAELGVTNTVLPVVTRSNHLSGATFSKDDWKGNAVSQYPVFLLNAPNVERELLPSAVRAYVQWGEDALVNAGYKCRIRKHWYAVPSIWTPDAFMLRQVHSFPKLVLNAAEATCTDTIHRVRFINGADARTVTAAFVNSITFAFSEVTGRSYGGGVLTFEPSEAENLPMPLLGAEHLDISKLDTLLRAGEVEKALDISDDILLRNGLGLDESEISSIRNIWKKLRNRRIYRRSIA